MIQINKNLPGSRAKVLSILANLDSFAMEIPLVQQVEIIDKSSFNSMTDWQVEIEGLPIHWIQETIFDRKSFTIRFEAIKGDLQKFEGKWIIRKGSLGTTDVEVQIDAKLGIPSIEAVIENTLNVRIQKIFESILDTVEDVMIDQKYEKKLSGAPRHKIEGFSIIGHPYDYDHLIRIFETFKPDVKQLTPEFLLKLFELAPSYHSADPIKIQASSGKQIEGYFVMCPIIPVMANFNPESVFKKVLEGCRVAERLGAGILALGGFTSIVGERYLTKLKSKVKIAITTGNTFTAALALDGIYEACKKMNVNLATSKVTLIGGTGDIGSACARVLAEQVKEVMVTGRDRGKLTDFKKYLSFFSRTKVSTSVNNNEAVKNADIVICAASSTQPIVDSKALKPGAIVCDVAYPKNISYRLKKERPDVFAFSGGLCKIPTEFDLGFDLGLPAKNVLYGCFSEAIVLSLEGRYENFSEGRGNITMEDIEWIRQAGKKHGFVLAPFTWAKESVDDNTAKMVQTKLGSLNKTNKI